MRPCLKVHKNDDRDAAAVAEAATRPTMNFVPVKTAEQLNLQALHRTRERLINQLRAILIERAMRISQGRWRLEKALGLE